MVLHADVVNDGIYRLIFNEAYLSKIKILFFRAIIFFSIFSKLHTILYMNYKLRLLLERENLIDSIFRRSLQL